MIHTKRPLGIRERERSRSSARCPRRRRLPYRLSAGELRPWAADKGEPDRARGAAYGNPPGPWASVVERALINPLRQTYFGQHRPASTLVEVSALVDPRLSVEIEAVAVSPD